MFTLSKHLTNSIFDQETKPINHLHFQSCNTNYNSLIIYLDSPLNPWDWLRKTILELKLITLDFWNILNLKPPQGSGWSEHYPWPSVPITERLEKRLISPVQPHSSRFRTATKASSRQHQFGSNINRFS